LPLIKTKSLGSAKISSNQRHQRYDFDFGFAFTFQITNSQLF